MTTNPEVALAIPFALDQFGNIVVTTNQDKIWADRVRSAIGTSINERVMRPNYGTKASHAAFETSQTAEQLVTREVIRIFHEQLPLLTFLDSKTSWNINDGTVTVEITYELPNKAESTTQVGIAYIPGNNQPYEEK